MMNMHTVVLLESDDGQDEWILTWSGIVDMMESHE
jgi:hypothetical protein